MPQYTIELTEAEDKALSVVSVSQLEWITNAVKGRCALAIEEIVKQEIERKLAAGETISGTKEDIVNAADIETAAERQVRYEAEQAARLAQEQNIEG